MVGPDGSGCSSAPSLKVPAIGARSRTPSRIRKCHNGAMGPEPRASGWQALCTLSRSQHSDQEISIMLVLASAAPVLAAGWSLLYLLFGGGIGGAVLIFFALKLLGR